MRVGLFDLDLDTWPGGAPVEARDENVRAIVDVLEACTYPWRRVYREVSGPRQPGIPIPIRFDDGLSGTGTSGYVTRNGITLAPSTLTGRPSAREEPFAYLVQAPNFAHELAHVADVWGLDGAQRDELAATATHRDLEDRTHPHAWRTGTWSHRLLEAFTYPWARAFVGDPLVYRTHTFAHAWSTDEAGLETFRSIVLRGDRPMFTDVPADHPHADSIERAAELGLVAGYPDGTYRPSEPLTRGQAATISVRQHDRLLEELTR